MPTIMGIMVLKLNEAMYSRAAAEDLVNTLLLNGYTLSMKQINTSLYIEYSAEITEEDSLMFPLIKKES